jgi:hypothetical protein
MKAYPSNVPVSGGQLRAPAANVEASGSTSHPDFRTRLGAYLAGAIAVLIATCISLEVTGFRYGVYTNVFHIPFVLDLSQQKEFAGDAFYASLKNYTSVIWLAIHMVANESNVEFLFHVAHILGRGATFAAFMVLLLTLSRRNVFVAVIGLAILAISPLMLGQSIIGRHDMLIDSFTHSVLTWPLVVLAFVSVRHGKLTLAAALSGICFAVNAFVGIWMIAILGMVCLSSEVSVSRRGLAESMVAFLIPALPVILWIHKATSGAGGVVHFSYQDYVRTFFPNHFLIEAANARAIALLVLLLLGGLAASRFVERPKLWAYILMAAFAVVLVGIPLPYLIDERYVFNLHLLRADGIVQLLATILIVAAGLRLIVDDESQAGKCLGLIVIVSMVLGDVHRLTWLALAVTSLCAALAHRHSLLSKLTRPQLKPVAAENVWPYAVIPVVAFTIIVAYEIAGGESALATLTHVLALLAVGVQLLEAIAPRLRRTFLPVLAAAGLFFAVGAERVVDRMASDEKVLAQSAAWDDMVAWVRQSDLKGPFLLPISKAAEHFQLQARRVVWVDKNQGAAVMWAPAFYDQWSVRYREVRQLSNRAEMARYAMKHGIRNMIVSDSLDGCPAPFSMRKRSGLHRVCSLD